MATIYQSTFGRLRDDAKQTVSKLRELVGDNQHSAETINVLAKEIASGNQDLSGRTREQASSLEETAPSMEQLPATVRQNADNALYANERAVTAQQVAEKGGEEFGQVVSALGAIHQSSSRIAEFIGVIDGIAFQTNILALNAAVEAARAGEQERGFAMVATKVRNLVQRSAAAAREFSGLISDSVGKVEVGDRLVAQAGRAMDEVVSSIMRAAKIMGDISMPAASRVPVSSRSALPLARWTKLRSRMQRWWRKRQRPLKAWKIRRRPWQRRFRFSRCSRLRRAHQRVWPLPFAPCPKQTPRQMQRPLGRPGN